MGSGWWDPSQSDGGIMRAGTGEMIAGEFGSIMLAMETLIGAVMWHKDRMTPEGSPVAGG